MAVASHRLRRSNDNPTRSYIHPSTACWKWDSLRPWDSLNRACLASISKAGPDPHFVTRCRLRDILILIHFSVLKTKVHVKERYARKDRYTPQRETLPRPARMRAASARMNRQQRTESSLPGLPFGRRFGKVRPTAPSFTEIHFLDSFRRHTFSPRASRLSGLGSILIRGT